MLGRLRRIVAGSVLFVMGVLLFVMGIEHIVVALVLLAAWAGSGVGLIAGQAWGRAAGLAVASVGLLVGVVLATQGTSSSLADKLFSGQDAGRWYVVTPMGYAYVVLSGAACTLLALPFRPRAESA